MQAKREFVILYDNKSGFPYVLAMENSCYPYFSTAFPENMLQGLEQVIRTGEADRSLERRIIQKCQWSHWPEYFRYCPDCACDDVKKHGDTYWHWLPQLPCIEYCPIHGKKIRNSSVMLRESAMAFLPASVEQAEIDGLEMQEGQIYKQKYVNIAQDTEWLLKNGIKLGDAEKLPVNTRNYLSKRGLQLHRVSAIRRKLKMNLSVIMVKNF